MDDGGGLADEDDDSVATIVLLALIFSERFDLGLFNPIPELEPDIGVGVTFGDGGCDDFRAPDLNLRHRN